MESTLKAEVDRDLIARAVSRHLGGARFLDCRELGGGRCNTVYQVDTDRGQFVIKVAPPNARMENEQQLLKEPHLSRVILGSCQVRVPRVMGAAGQAGGSGRAYVLMERLPGVSLEKAWDELCLADRDRLAVEVGQLLADLSQVTAPLFGWIDHRGLLQGYPTWAGFFRERGFLKLNYLGFVCGVDVPRLIRLKRLCADAVDDQALTPSFVHGNLANMSNIMIDPDVSPPKLVGVIDLEHAQFADPDVELPGFRHWGDWGELVEQSYRRRNPASHSWPRRREVYGLLEEIRQLISWYHLTPDKYRAALHNRAALARVDDILGWDGEGGADA